MFKSVETLLTTLRDSFNKLVYGKQFIGYETITLTLGTVKKLTVPTGATEAILQVEASSGSTTLPSARFTLHGIDPVAGQTGAATEIGIPTYSCTGGDFVIRGYDNLLAFKIISAYATGTQSLKVLYYK